MPGYDAVELLRDFVAVNRATPIVLFSGWRREVPLVVADLAKPISFTVLGMCSKPPASRCVPKNLAHVDPVVIRVN